MPLDPDCARAVHRTLTGRLNVSLCDGRVQVLFRSLPGRALAAATETPDGVLWIVVDMDKPSAVQHARQLILGCFTGGPDGPRLAELSDDEQSPGVLNLAG